MPQKPLPEQELVWMQAVGRRVRKARKDAGIKQQEFAKMIGMSPTTYNKFEQGRAKIQLCPFFKACIILKKDANSIMGRKRRDK